MLLKYLKHNLSPSQRDPNWALLLKMPPRWFEQWQGFWLPYRTFCCCSLGILRTELFPSNQFRVLQQGWAILYHLIILKSLGCLTFPPGWRQCSWFQATNFCPFSSGQKGRLETHSLNLPIPIPSSFLCSHSLQWWSMGESAIEYDSLSLNSSRDAHIWSFLEHGGLNR